MHDATDKINEGKLDLVPMIDCVMLLLLFFILTTKFTAEEKQIAALLPSQGQAQMKQEIVVEPPKEVRLTIIPAGFEFGLEPSMYQRRWDANKPTTALLRIGGADPIRIDARLLSKTDDQAMRAHLESIHHYVATALGGYENTGARNDQSPISIHCFSGLSWSYALCAYDAVRAYENLKSPPRPVDHTSSLLDESARTVTFAPPRVRNYNQHELGDELWELIHQK